MWKSPATSYLVRRLAQLRSQDLARSFSSFVDAPTPNRIGSKPGPAHVEDKRGGRGSDCCSDRNDAAVARGFQIGKNVSRRDKVQFLVDTLLDLKDSKEAVYGALDAWVAWEDTFPIGSLRKALVALEKEQQWHRIVQVIKWMLSKGQGNTMGTYGQFIRALDRDHRAEEAHEFWTKRIGRDLHSVPWQLCHLMISIYYRNNMPQRLIKLFCGLEAFNRKPPEKAIVQRVADTYEILDMLEEKERVLKKYSELFNESGKGGSKKLKKASAKKKKKPGNKVEASSPDQRKQVSSSDSEDEADASSQ